MTPNHNPMIGPAHFAEIIRRIERLDEWTQFEAKICKLRAQLHLFMGPIPFSIVGSGAQQAFPQPFYEATVRSSWETLHQEHRVFLEAFPEGYRHIGKTLDGNPHDAIKWVAGLRDLANAIEDAIIQALSIPRMRDGCNKLQSNVNNCLEQISKAVNKEIGELVWYTNEIQKMV